MSVIQQVYLAESGSSIYINGCVQEGEDGKSYVVLREVEFKLNN